MSGIFPNAADGGVSCDVVIPPGHCPVTPPLTNPLYYGSGCDVRLRPEVLNSLISEIAASVDQAALAYDPTKTNNLELSIRYMIQRGLPHSGNAQGGPQNYTLTLDPAPVAYTNYLALLVVPALTNTGAVTLNVNGLGARQVVRNDGLQLRSEDWQIGIPTLIAFYGGRFYQVGLVSSQVPLVMSNNVNRWVRTDGNDSTGDGLVNSPDSAYRTINAALASVTSRFAASQQFAINIRLGIAGTYEAATINQSNNQINLLGDALNPGAYKIAGTAGYEGQVGWAVNIGNGRTNVTGIRALIDYPLPNKFSAFRIGSNVLAALNTCEIEVMTNNTAAYGVWVANSSYAAFSDKFNFIGNNRSIGVGFQGLRNSQICNASDFAPTAYRFENLIFNATAMRLDEQSSINFVAGTTSITNVNTTGSRWRVTGLSLLQMGGFTMPGSTDGTVANGGIAVA